MGAMHDTLENKLIDFIFRNQSITLGASTATWSGGAPTLHIGLLTTTPTDGTAGTEVSGGSYVRQPVTAGTVNWSATNSSSSTANPSTGTSGTTYNLTQITFSPAPTGNWGTINGVGIYDAATAGNLLFWSALGTPKTVNNGDSAPYYAVGALSVQIDN